MGSTMALSAYGGNQIQLWMYAGSGAALPPPSEFYVAIGNLVSGAFIEPMASLGYARQPAGMMASGNVYANSGAVLFGPSMAPGWGIITEAALTDAVSGGNIWWYAPLDLAQTVPVGSGFIFLPGTISTAFPSDAGAGTGVPVNLPALGAENMAAPFDPQDPTAPAISGALGDITPVLLQLAPWFSPQGGTLFIDAQTTTDIWVAFGATSGVVATSGSGLRVPAGQQRNFGVPASIGWVCAVQGVTGVSGIVAISQGTGGV